MQNTSDRIAVAADRFMNPILVKELRSTFRGWKFMAVHSGFLAVLAAGLVVALLSMADIGRVKPEEVGQGIHAIFLAGLFFSAVFVLPSFASTAIVSEREANTLEMLNTTTLSPGAVIRGKFLASMVYSAAYLFSSLPMGAVAFLFGGVKVSHLALAYGSVFALSAVSNMFSIFVSAHLRSSRTALGSTAMFGLFLSATCAGFFFNALSPGLRALAADLFGLGSLVRSVDWYSGVVPRPALADALLGLLALPVFLLVSAFWFSAASASNRLKGRSGNRSTNLKLFFLFFMTAGSALWITMISRASYGSEEERWHAIATFMGALGVMITLSAYFSAEDPWRSLTTRLRKRTGFFILDSLRPGSANGMVFCVTGAALILSTVTAALAPITGQKYFPAIIGLCATTAAFMFMTASAGLFFSTVIRVDWMRMGLQSAVVMTMLFTPLISFGAIGGFKEISSVSALNPGLLSPVVAFGSLITGFHEHYLVADAMQHKSIFPYMARFAGASVPSFVPSVAFNIAVGTALTVVAAVRLRKTTP